MIQEFRDRFAALHVPGDPVLLYNIWDVASAQAVVAGGAKALATGSHAVAESQGFPDGEGIPFNLFLEATRRIVEGVDLPVTADFESGFAADPAHIADHARQLAETGAIGCNFEDQVIGGEGLYSIERQSARIRAIREAANDSGVPLFINARTDIFLKTLPAAETEEQLAQALERASAYADAGASGFFAPGLRDPEMIRRLCEGSPLPVNIFVIPGVPSNNEMAGLGVARISYGPGPYRQMIEWLKGKAAEVFAG